jgi:hypothetical protein
VPEIGTEAGSGTATPAAVPGTNAQIIVDTCHPIRTTSNRLASGGKYLFTAAIAELPSTFRKFDQSTLEIMSNETISGA